MKFLTPLVLFTTAISTSPAFACSICRCGDPTFNALGKEGVAQIGLRSAFDWDQTRKTQGEPGGEFDSLRENRTTLMLAYGVSDAVGVFVRVPFARRELTATADGITEQTHASGLADPELYGQVRVWSSPFEGDVGLRASIYAIGGVKTSWGKNDVALNGERLDEHVQPGTGSTDWFGGLSGSYQLDQRSALFASVQYRQTGENDHDYRYGRISLVNVAYERKLTSRWDAVLELNYRHAGFDRNAGIIEADTGGSITYATPRLLFDLGNGWIARASAQIPLTQSGLNGHQHEKAVFNLGMTFLFGS